MKQSDLTRRSAIASLACLASGRVEAFSPGRIRIGIMDQLLGAPSQPEAIALAASLGFDGIQLTIGKPGSSGRLTLSNADLQGHCLEVARAKGIALTSTYLDVLHQNCLKNDALARTWVKEGIAITKALNASILMLVFFGKCALEGAGEVDAVIDPLIEASRQAAEAGIVLGFENTLSAETNAGVLDRVNSPALKVFYDIGNSTNIGHYDVPREIRFLGRDRICQFHIKDKSYLGTGKVDVPGSLRAMRDIGYSGFAVLETAAPSGNPAADASRNLKIFKNMLSEAKLRS